MMNSKPPIGRAFHGAALVVAALVLGGCMAAKPELPRDRLLGCNATSDCPEGYSCTLEGACKSGEAICGDGVVDEEYGEACDDGNDEVNDRCPSGPTGNCQPARCGDGFLWDSDGGLEQCELDGDAVLDCDDVVGSDLDGSISCSEVNCRYNTSACFNSPNGFVRVEAGVFTMGSPESELGRDDDELLHQVTLSTPFFILEHEVTQAQWEERMGNNPSFERGDCSDCPLTALTWWEALQYANVLSLEEGLTPCYVLTGCTGVAGVGFGVDDAGEFGGLVCTDVSLQDAAGQTVSTPYECQGYRLPTEAEWEYANRAGTASAFYSGPITVPFDGADPNLDSIGWYEENSPLESDPNYATVRQVKLKAANGWGLYDMSGNAWEWVWDGYQESLGADAVVDPCVSATGPVRVRRGGGWFDPAKELRAASRSISAADQPLPWGFRLVRSASP